MDLTLELTPEECSPPWLEWSVKGNVQRTPGPITTSVTFLGETPTTSTVVQTMSLSHASNSPVRASSGALENVKAQVMEDFINAGHF